MPTSAAGRRARGARGRRRRAHGYNAVEGLSLVKPPYGVMSAIDLRSGTLKWQVPHGDTPDVVRNTIPS
jgi:quinoprotein glucose dehydrogenase